MKYIFKFVALFLLFTTSVCTYAQETLPIAKQFNFGVTVGGNLKLSTEDENTFYNPGLGYGFNAGFTGYWFAKNFPSGTLYGDLSVLLGRDRVHYELADSSYTGNNYVGVNGESYDDHSTYLKFPLQAGFAFDVDEKWTVGPKLGAVYAFELPYEDEFWVSIIGGCEASYKKKLRLALNFEPNIRKFYKYNGRFYRGKFVDGVYYKSKYPWHVFNLTFTYLLF